MVILGLILWSIFGIWGTKVMVEEIFGYGTDRYTAKMEFSPEQVGGLIFLPVGGIVTLFLAYLIASEVISLKWDK